MDKQRKMVNGIPVELSESEIAERQAEEALMSVSKI